MLAHTDGLQVSVIAAVIPGLLDEGAYHLTPRPVQVVGHPSIEATGSHLPIWRQRQQEVILALAGHFQLVLFAHSLPCWTRGWDEAPLPVAIRRGFLFSCVYHDEFFCARSCDAGLPGGRR